MSFSPEEIIRSFPQFGGRYHEDALAWILSMEEVFARAHIPTSHQYSIAQYYLTGDAVQWFRFHKHPISDWFTFKSEILKTFQSSFIPTLQLAHPHQRPFSSFSIPPHSPIIVQETRPEENSAPVPMSAPFEILSPSSSAVLPLETLAADVQLPSVDDTQSGLYADIAPQHSHDQEQATTGTDILVPRSVLPNLCLPCDNPLSTPILSSQSSLVRADISETSRLHFPARSLCYASTSQILSMKSHSLSTSDPRARFSHILFQRLFFPFQWGNWKDIVDPWTHYRWRDREKVSGEWKHRKWKLCSLSHAFFLCVSLSLLF